MGNCARIQKQIKINQRILKPVSNSYKPIKLHSRHKPSTINNMLDKDFLQVLDYLKFDELKEVGKIDRHFNQGVKSINILIKFFKKKEESIVYQPIILHNESTSYIEKKNSLCSFGYH